jgi:hypothetical protein
MDNKTRLAQMQEVRSHPKTERKSKGEHMTDTFIETVLWFMEYAWLMVIASLVLLTLPIWFMPYAVFKILKYFGGNT